MKRDDLVLPLETDPLPLKPRDLVQEGMNHYYWRDPDALRRLLEKLVAERRNE